MATYLTKEKKSEIFKQYGGAENNTGSTEGQIALFTYRIQSLSQHLLENKKDTQARKTLLQLVGKRRNLLKYLATQDIQKYRDLLVELKIRK